MSPLPAAAIVPPAGRERTLRRLGVALLCMIFLFDVAIAAVRWPAAIGRENERIAKSIAAGQGFSFPVDGRWLFGDDLRPRSEIPTHFPSAWQEPGPAYALAAAFSLFGERGRLAMLVLNALALVGTLLAAYHIGRRLGGVAAGLAGAGFFAVLPMTHETTTGWLGNTNLGMLALTVAALATLWCLDRPTASRAIGLGAILGVAAHFHAATLQLIPIAALAVLVLSDMAWRKRAGAAAMVVLAAALVLAPWTVRNYRVFDELVLVRNGTGIMSFFGNRLLADTFAGDRMDPGPRPAPPPIHRTAAEAWEAAVEDDPARNRLMRSAPAWLASVTPGYSHDLNEAQRDKLYLHHALAFAGANPRLAAELAVAKLRTFLFPPHRRSLLPLSVTAVLGMVAVLLGRRDPRVWVVALFVAAYTGLFAFTAPVWPRYRLGIEPLISVLAGYALVRLAEMAAGRFLAARSQAGQISIRP